MIRLQQNTGEHGNCWSTCLACLMNQTYAPDIDPYADDFLEQSEKWVNRFGYALLELAYDEHLKVGFAENVLCILTGRSPRDVKVFHSVIGKMVHNKFIIEHDPHPSSSGIVSIECVTFLLKLQ